jgi:tetratricopeptide (TPR) repeat protein
VVYYQLGELDKAIEHFGKAIEIAPDDAGIHSNLASAYVQKHMLKGSEEHLTTALATYEKAAELDPELAEAQFGLGVVHLLREETDKAIEAFERFQELDTGNDPYATQDAANYLKQLKGE